jgi:hypothetical protein
MSDRPASGLATSRAIDGTALMASLTYTKPQPIPVPVASDCSAGCDLGRAVRGWLFGRRELLADLAAARGRDDAEVLRTDLAPAKRRVDARIEFSGCAA